MRLVRHPKRACFREVRRPARAAAQKGPRHRHLRRLRGDEPRDQNPIRRSSTTGCVHPFVRPRPLTWFMQGAAAKGLLRASPYSLFTLTSLQSPMRYSTSPGLIAALLACASFPLYSCSASEPDPCVADAPASEMADLSSGGQLTWKRQRSPISFDSTITHDGRTIDYLSDSGISVAVRLNGPTADDPEVYYATVNVFESGGEYRGSGRARVEGRARSFDSCVRTEGIVMEPKLQASGYYTAGSPAP